MRSHRNEQKPSTEGAPGERNSIEGFSWMIPSRFPRRVTSILTEEKKPWPSNFASQSASFPLPQPLERSPLTLSGSSAGKHILGSGCWLCTPRCCNLVSLLFLLKWTNTWIVKSLVVAILTLRQPGYLRAFFLGSIVSWSESVAFLIICMKIVRRGAMISQCVFGAAFFLEFLFMRCSSEILT